MRARYILRALTNFHAYEFSRLSASSHASFRRIIRFARARPHASTHGAAWNHAAHSEGPSINSTLLCSAKSSFSFSPPYVGTHARARARTHRERRIAVEFTRLLLHALKSGNASGGLERSREEEGVVHSATSPGCSSREWQRRSGCRRRRDATRRRRRRRHFPRATIIHTSSSLVTGRVKARAARRPFICRGEKHARHDDE